jgi:AcrR family transcriptional regulator
LRTKPLPRERDRRERSDRRREIIDTAIARLVTDGFERLRVRDVADAVGINQATLLYHVRDKETLIIAMVDELIARLRSHNATNDERATGFGAFDAHVRTLRDLYLDDPAVYVALTEIATRSIRDQRIAAKIAAVEREWTGYVTHLLRLAAPRADAQSLATTAAATIVFLRGIAAKTAGDGTLAALLARPGSRRRIAVPIFTAVDTYLALVHRSFAEGAVDRRRNQGA